MILDEWNTARPGTAIDLACLVLRHTSNFTDLDALRIEPDVQVRLVHTVSELGAPDAVIIPGSRTPWPMPRIWQRAASPRRWPPSPPPAAARWWASAAGCRSSGA